MSRSSSGESSYLSCTCHIGIINESMKGTHKDVEAQPRGTDSTDKVGKAVCRDPLGFHDADSAANLCVELGKGRMPSFTCRPKPSLPKGRAPLHQVEISAFRLLSTPKCVGMSDVAFMRLSYPTFAGFRGSHEDVGTSIFYKSPRMTSLSDLIASSEVRTSCCRKLCAYWMVGLRIFIFKKIT